MASKRTTSLPISTASKTSPRSLLPHTEQTTQHTTPMNDESPSRQPSMPPTPQPFQAPVSCLEDIVLEGLADILGKPPAPQEPFVPDEYTNPCDIPKLRPEDDFGRNIPGHGIERVLEPPIDSTQEAEPDYMSLEVDEVQALRDIMNRMNSGSATATAVDTNSKYQKYGYPFESWEDMNNTYRECGFPGYTSPFDEKPIVVVDEEERQDLARLERIDGLMGTKEMLDEMEKML